jgi:DNA-binding MarR family transcriptional regulator
MAVRRLTETEISDFTQALGLLVRRIRSAAAGQELSLTEASVIARLARDGPATTAELARAEGMKAQSMGTTVAGLEESGLVERRPHATDGRQLIVSLSAKGAALRKSTKDAKHTWLTHALTRLTEEERGILFEAGEIMRRLVEE